MAARSAGHRVAAQRGSTGPAPARSRRHPRTIEQPLPCTSRPRGSANAVRLSTQPFPHQDVWISSSLEPSRFTNSPRDSASVRTARASGTLDRHVARLEVDSLHDRNVEGRIDGVRDAPRRRLPATVVGDEDVLPVGWSLIPPETCRPRGERCQLDARCPAVRSGDDLRTVCSSVRGAKIRASRDSSSRNLRSAKPISPSSPRARIRASGSSGARRATSMTTTAAGAARRPANNGLGVVVDEVDVVDHQRRRRPTAGFKIVEQIDDGLVYGPWTRSWVSVCRTSSCIRPSRAASTPSSGWRRGRLRRVTTTP